jgi:hypothetical protein
LFLLFIGLGSVAHAQSSEEEPSGGQSRESMANDATASQWTYQLAYEWRDWRDDTLSNGQTRAPGNKNMWQFRIVAPLTKEMTGAPWTILPRLTLRNNEAVDGRSGAGNGELFALVIPWEWASGRFGIGPQINFPAESEQLGTTAWRFGFATALLERAVSDKLMYGFLIQQLWGKTNPTDENDIVASPITLQPVLNYTLSKGFYVNIGETALSYNWQAKAWLVPIGIRFGKLWVGDRTTWNLYGEYRTAVIYEDWPGSVIQNAFRINVSYTMPVGS